MDARWNDVQQKYERFKAAQAAWHAIRDEGLGPIGLPSDEATRAISAMREAWRDFEDAIEPYMRLLP